MKHISKYLQMLSLIFLLSGVLVTIHAQTPSESPKAKPTPKASPTPSQILPEIAEKIKSLNSELNQAQTVLTNGQKLALMTFKEVSQARKKLNEALERFQLLAKKLKDEKLKQEMLNAESQAYNYFVQIDFMTQSGINQTYYFTAITHRTLGEWEKLVEYLLKTNQILNEILSNKSFQENEKIRNNGLIFSKIALTQNHHLIADILDNIGQIEKSIRYKKIAIQGFRDLYGETQDKQYKYDEALSLFTLGLIYGRQSKDRGTALKYLIQAKSIFSLFPEKRGRVADCLKMIATFYNLELNYMKAKENLQKALKIYQEVNDMHGQASMFQGIALIYWILNDRTNFEKYINEAQKILESPKYIENWKNIIQSGAKDKDYWDKTSEFLVQRSRYNDLAIGHKLLKDYKKSLTYYKKALEISQLSKQSRDISLDYSNIASILAKSKRWNEATGYFLKTYKISKDSEVKEDIAKAAQDVGWVLSESNNFDEALKYQNEALKIYQTIGINEDKTFSISFSGLLAEISRTYYGLENKRLAIFYGKRAINSIQNERQRLQNLDPISQKGFLEKKQKHYRRLAEWLVESGRIVEAERVLQMLKQEEIADYLRKDRTFAEKLSLRVEYTKTEAQAIKDFEKNSENLSAIGAKFGKLENLKRNGIEFTDEQEKRFVELKANLTKANQEFQSFLEQLAIEFQKGKKVGNELQENKALKSDLEEWGEGLAIIYTLVSESKFVSILTTPTSEVSQNNPITSAKLNKKIFAFREAVKNPQVDPRPLGKELYDILIKPFEKDLDAAKTKTILWSLDGNLRLLPLAALWDGEQYFGQKYQNVIFTLASRTRLGDEVSANPNVLALGVSEAKTIKETLIKRKLTFNALPSVPFELDSIVKTDKSPKGVLTGVSLLNEGFTKKSLENQLSKRYKIVHIASHFSMNAGDSSNSFLLLGDGTTLTMNELNINPSLKFTGVELLTLSACETAVSGNVGSGKEVEGFAFVAQQKGAKAILATLWSVADNSTALMMAEFYRIKKEDPQFTKAKAMQLAQQAMIDGKLKTDTKGNKKGVETFKNGSKTNNLPKFKTDKNKPFAHPYYWSPFVLIGNWK